MHRSARIPVYLFLGLLLGLSLNKEVQGQILFDEVAVAAGIGSDTYDSSSDHGLGIIWIDYDNDGFPDLYAVNGNGLSPHLFHNEGDGTFTNQDALLPTMPLVEQTGAMFADYDNDGDQDIYITVGSVSPDDPDGGVNMLLQNQWVENGNQLSTPLFIDVAAAAGVDNKPATPFGTLEGYASYTGAWLDYDRDSCIDLFVGNMDWDDAGASSNANQLYKNNCDGTFTDVTVSSGVDTGDTNDLRPTLAFFGGLLTPGDMDPDIYVVNVHDASPFHHDLIYDNNGDGTFTEFSGTMPTFGDDSGAGMGTAVADIDHDGDWDIYITDLPDPGGVEPVAEGNVLYLGNPDGTWSENAAPAADVESNASWGANFADFDQDGYEDLWVGTIAPNNPVQSIYQNNGDGTFDDITGSAGFLTGFPARGTAAADYDRDGDIDIVQINLADRINLYENISTGQGNYLQVDLNATVSNRSAIGTLVEATVGSTTYMRQVNGGASAHSQDDLLVHFGLGSATTVDELKIFWPSGTVQTLTNVGVNQLLSITEDGGGGGSTLSSDSLTVDFGFVEEGMSSGPVPIRLSNDGTDALDVTNVSITGVDAGDFSHDFAGPVTIPGGGTSTLNVTFSPTASAAPMAASVIYRVNAGGSLVSDWEEDSDSNPSSYVDPVATIAHTTTETITLDATVPAGTPVELFQSARADGAKAAPNMEWDFPVTSGDELTIRLFFAEIVRCQAGAHLFDVVIEGTTVLDDYDVFADVGCEVGTMKEFSVTAGDGNLDIDFPLAGNNRPSIVSAIEIESESGTGADIRTADLIIDHTGTNPSLTIPMSGETSGTGGGNLPPTADFSFTATDLSVSFTDASSDSDGSVVSWIWDFGDGNSSADQNPVHVYAADGTYTVMLTVTDDMGATDNTSQDVTVSSGGGNEAPTADFTFAVTDLSVAFTDASTDSDGTVVSWSWDFGDGNSSTDQNPTHAYADYGAYTVSLTVTDDDGATGNTSQEVNVPDPNADGPFIESGGMAVMEAENFHTRIDRSDHSWVENSDNAGFSGATAMLSDPDDGTFISADITTTSPELVFDVDITTTGDYHLWVRIWAASSSSNSVHVGMNGEIDPQSKGAQTQTIGSWVWLKLARGGNALPYNVGSVGLHTFNLWMREDGTWVDKIVITTDGAFVPTGEGPAESPQGSASQSSRGRLDALTIGETLNDVPAEFALDNNYPNPFNPTTTVPFALPESANVRLIVYDAMGRQVATLVDASLNAGRHEAVWNARNDAGDRVASGLYLIRMTAGSFNAVRQIVLLK